MNRENAEIIAELVAKEQSGEITDSERDMLSRIRQLRPDVAPPPAPQTRAQIQTQTKRAPAPAAAGQRRPMTAEEKRNAGREAARAAIAADPSILEDPDDPFEGSESSGAVGFGSTKPDKNGMTPQQRKALGKQDARAELDTAQR